MVSIVRGGNTIPYTGRRHRGSVTIAERYDRRSAPDEAMKSRLSGWQDAKVRSVRGASPASDNEWGLAVTDRIVAPAYSADPVARES